MHLPKFQFSFIILNFWVPFLTSCWLLPEHLSSDHWDVLDCPSKDHNTANHLTAPALYFYKPTHLPGGFSLHVYIYHFLMAQKRQRNQKSNCQHLLDHQKSKWVPEKHLLLLYWLCQRLWLYGSLKNCGKFWKRWEYQTTWPASWEICMQIKKQQLELDMEQQTGSKSGKSTSGL